MPRLAATLALATLALGVSSARAADPPAAPPADAPPAALTQPPKLTKFVRAESPPSLAERGSVDVILAIDIDDKGKVAKVVVEQTGGAEFDAAALAAAQQFEFNPGYAGDKPVPVRITYRYRFKMQPATPPPPPTPAPGDASTPGAPAPVDTVPFSGTVLRKGDRTAVPGANVFVDLAPAPATPAAAPAGAGQPAVATPATPTGPEPLTAITDNDGRFSFPAVPVGKHKVRVAGAGLQPSDTEETFNKGKKLEATYYAYVRERYSSVVRGKRLVKDTVEQTLDIEEIKRIPGTQGDVLKSVQNLPGVARSAFGGGQLVVWGSRPGDTRVYVDGVYIPVLFHFAGLRAVVPSESVQSLTFTPGGYGAENGNALGGIVQVDTSSPKSNGYHGFLQLDIIDGSFRVEGPITKKLDFAVSARRSWIDIFLPLFTPNNFQLSPKYWDYQAKLRWRPTERDEVELFVFGSDDIIEVKTRGNANPQANAQFGTHTYFHRGVGRWLHRFGGGAQLEMVGSIGYEVPFSFNAQFGTTGLNVSVAACPYTLRATLRQPVASFLRVDAGVNFEGARWGESFLSPLSAAPVEGDAPGGGGGGGLAAVLQGKVNFYNNTVGPFVALQFSFFEKKLSLTPGLRVAIIENNGNYDTSFGGRPEITEVNGVALKGDFSNVFVRYEPRVAGRYQIIPQLAVKAAMGVYSQPPNAQTLSGPFGNVKALPESAYHYVFGFDITPYQGLNIATEVFYKDLRNIIVRGDKPGDPAYENEGIGRVYGGEILVRQELFKGFFGWLSYTISRSERKDHPSDPDWRLFQFDQTHILTAIASYKFGRGYQVGARFRYVTGNPTTPITSAYVNLNSGTYTPVYGPVNSGRLTGFNQLDIRFDKEWTYDRFRFGVYVDIQNLYNASNAESVQYNYDFTNPQPVAGIPFFPALGVRGDF